MPACPLTACTLPAAVVAGPPTQNKRGIHSNKEVQTPRVNDVSTPGNGQRAKQYLPFLQRAGKLFGTVENVSSGEWLLLCCVLAPCYAGCPRDAPYEAASVVTRLPWGFQADVFGEWTRNQVPVLQLWLACVWSILSAAGLHRSKSCPSEAHGAFSGEATRHCIWLTVQAWMC